MRLGLATNELYKKSPLLKFVYENKFAPFPPPQKTPSDYGKRMPTNSFAGFKSLLSITLSLPKEWIVAVGCFFFKKKNPLT